MSTPTPNSVSPVSPVLAYIHTRFREVFGEPSNTLELDSQWSIRSEPMAPAIFLLVNGSYEKPAVWIFDPFTANNIWRESVTTEAEVDAAVVEVQTRLKAAARE